MMFFGWFWMVVPVLIIAAVVLAARSRDDSGNDRGRRVAEQTLAQRYASGQIDQQEYRQRIAVISETSPQTPTRPERQWWLMITITVIVLLVGGLLWAGTGPNWRWGHMGWNQTTQTSGVAEDGFPSAPTIEIIADDLSFEPTSFAVNTGEPTNIVVTNLGRVFHDLTIPELEITIAVDPDETVEAGLKVDQTGEFEFLCTVPGHADAGMRGTLTVS